MSVGADEQIVIVHVGKDGPVEVARHARATPGTPTINDDHFPPQPAGPLDRRPRAKNPAQVEFLDLGEGAALWLVEAAAAGTQRMRVKMAEALWWLMTSACCRSPRTPPRGSTGSSTPPTRSDRSRCHIPPAEYEANHYAANPASSPELATTGSLH